mmetsp:Transcript_73378/g.157212  ORF Transcript_73378/g.157212 Transcript_73378/m.157212 type:complete len:104 (+) Transcript_73378:574-885(+)
MTGGTMTLVGDAAGSTVVETPGAVLPTETEDSAIETLGYEAVVIAGDMPMGGKAVVMGDITTFAEENMASDCAVLESGEASAWETLPPPPCTNCWLTSSTFSM